MLEKEGVPEKLKAAADHVDRESIREDAKAILEAIDAKDDLDAVLAFAAMATKFGLDILI